MNTLWRELLCAIIIGNLIGTVIVNWARDNTDPIEGWRSGMSLYTDELTGCQYLGTLGALTPRLAPEGHQICKENE